MSGDKTEPPTPKKIRDARKKGDVAKSKEVVSAALTIAIFGYMFANGPAMVRDFMTMIVYPAQFYGMESEDAISRSVDGLLDIALGILTPLMVLVLAIGVASNYFQIGFLFTFDAVMPKLSKLNPGSNLKNMFSKKSLVEFLKSVFKISVLSLMIAYVLREGMRDLLGAARCGIPCVFTVMTDMLGTILIFTAAAFAAVAAFDFAFEKTQYTNKLKMSKDEIKREYKESEGDPLIKGKRKQMFQEILMHDTGERVRKSSVLVTNPTRIAIALYYDEDETPLPVVMAKGQDHVARKMIEIAKEEGIPIMENVPLARALNEDVEVDRYIPSDLIEPVAEVLRLVREMSQ